MARSSSTPARCRATSTRRDRRGGSRPSTRRSTGSSAARRRPCASTRRSCAPSSRPSAGSTRRRRRSSSPSSATRARTRGCATRCSTCRSTRSSSCGSASCRPATTRHSWRRTCCRGPTATSACPRVRAGSCGSWTTGRLRSRGPPDSSRSSCRTAASCTRCRSTAARSPTRATRSCVTADRRDDLLVLLAAALPLAVLLLRERLIAGSAGFPLDDSWIHLHFARNIAEGAGFAYNPGVPVAGSTAPLWTLLLAAGARVAGASLVMVKTLGVACALATALVLRRAALAWGASPPTALVAAIALLWSGPFAWGALSGMEVTLAALLVAAALLALARDRLVLTAVAGGLATLARPEAVVLLPFLALARRPTPKRLALFAVVVVLALLPFAVFCWATTGTPVPSTAAAKVEGGLLGRLLGLREPARVTWLDRPLAFGVEWLVWLTSTHPLLPLALPAIALAWRGSEEPSGNSPPNRRRGGRARGLVGLVLLAHPLAMAVLAPYRGPGFQEGRYSIHLLPVALLLLAVVFGPWREAVASSLNRVSVRNSALAASLARVLYLAVALVPLAPAADRYAWGVQNINAMQVHLGRWVDANLPRSATPAVNDVGAIAYFSRRRVLDLMGLVTPEIRPYRREGEAGVLRFVAERCPDFVIVFPAWFPEITARRDLLTPVYRVRLERNEVSGGPEMVVYRLARCAV